MRIDGDKELTDTLEAIERKLDHLTDEIAAIRREAMWGKVWAFIRFVIVLAPLLAAAVYLAPLARSFYAEIQHVLSQANQVLNK